MSTPLLLRTLQMTLQEFLYSVPEVHAGFHFVPAVAFVSVNNPLDIRIGLRQHISKSPSMIDRHPKVLRAIGEKNRLLDLGSVMQRRVRLKLGRVFLWISHETRKAKAANTFRGVRPVVSKQEFDVSHRDP